jgi:hypothetical protein
MGELLSSGESTHFSGLERSKLRDGAAHKLYSEYSPHKQNIRNSLNTEEKTLSYCSSFSGLEEHNLPHQSIRQCSSVQGHASTISPVCGLVRLVMNEASLELFRSSDNQRLFSLPLDKYHSYLRCFTALGTDNMPLNLWHMVKEGRILQLFSDFIANFCQLMHKKNRIFK